LDRLDIQKTEIQRGGERKCRKINKPALPFSPPIQELDLCQQAYVNLVKWHKNGQSSSKHVFCKAACHGIENPRKLTVKQCKQGAAACRKLLKEHKKDVNHLRKVHLRNRYKLALDLKDSKKCAWIKEIMTGEQQEDDWRKINQETGNLCTGATNLVQRQEGDKIIDILESDAMVQEIQSVTKKRFKLANSATVNTSLSHCVIGFCTSTDYAINLLQGKVPIPFNFNNTTILLVEEMQCIYAKLEHLHSLMVITPEIYQYYWSHTRECTSSAWSNIHFGNWKAIRQLDKLTHLTCTQLNLIAACAGGTACKPS
jgi:hypothetical protein